MKEIMSASALLKYMQTCHASAICSVVLVSMINPKVLPVFELNWYLNGKIIARTFSEGHLYRNNRALQKEFIEVKELLNK